MGSISNIVYYVINYHCAKFGAFTINSTILVKFCTILLDYNETAALYQNNSVGVELFS